MSTRFRLRRLLPRPESDVRRLLPGILLTGLAGGVLAVAFLFLLHWATRWLGPQAHGPWVHVAVMGGAGLVVALLARWFGSPGDVDLLVDNIHLTGGHARSGDWKALWPMALLCVGSGGAAGPEAPLVQTTGEWGTLMARRLKVGPRARRILTLTGMAAGFTALFGAPLGGAVFALEILHRRGLQYHEALLPATIGSLAGYAVFILASGLGLAPVWTLPPVEALAPMDLLWAVGAGLAGALAGGAFIGCVKLLRRLFGLLPAWLRPALGGVLLGLLGVVAPAALTFGEAQLDGVVAGALTVGAALALAGAKFLGTSLTLASGWRGGFIIPLFFIGAALAQAAHALWPGAHHAMLIACLMVAVNTAVTKTPLGSSLVVTRMGGLPLLPTTLLAAITAWLCSGGYGMIESQRQRHELAADAPSTPVHP